MLVLIFPVVYNCFIRRQFCGKLSANSIFPGIHFGMAYPDDGDIARGNMISNSVFI
jgi:hypothetical protein